MAEWKMHNMENGRKYTHWKMVENAQLENARMQSAQQGKCHNGKYTTWKMTENSHTGKWQKIHTWKMPESKMHNIENERKHTYRKMAENAHLEIARFENAQHGK